MKISNHNLTLNNFYRFFGTNFFDRIMIYLLSILAVLLARGIRVETYGGTIIAFGDATGRTTYRSLNRFLSRNIIPGGSSQDFVCLLGNSFSEFPKLTDKLTTDFLVVIGDKDEHKQLAKYEADPRFIYPGDTYVEARYVDEEFGDEEQICLWSVDSVNFTETDAERLDTAFAETRETCHWNIVLSHLPLYSFGKHFNNTRIIEYRNKIIPILKKYQIHLFLSSHDCSTQVVKIDELPNTVMLVIGAPITVDYHSIKNLISETIVGASLLWYDDETQGLVLRLNYCLESIVWEIVNIRNEKIELSGLIANED